MLQPFLFQRLAEALPSDIFRHRFRDRRPQRLHRDIGAGSPGAIGGAPDEETQVKAVLSLLVGSAAAAYQIGGGAGNLGDVERLLRRHAAIALAEFLAD